jgi:hypothetical protein
MTFLFQSIVYTYSDLSRQEKEMYIYKEFQYQLHALSDCICHGTYMSRNVYVTDRICHGPYMSRNVYVTERICHTCGTYSIELITAVFMCHILFCNLEVNA